MANNKNFAVSDPSKFNKNKTKDIEP